MGIDTAALAERASAFRQLHEQNGTFIMPNAWDAGSAKLLANAGFKAIATTSGGVNWAAGRRDYVYEVPSEEMLAAYGEIASAVDIAVSGDLENGYGDSPQQVADTITRSMHYGMVGGSIEDYTADQAKPLYDIELAVERIVAAREAADQSGISYTLTARAESYFVPGHPDPISDAITRANRYREAGADCIFVPCPTEAETIARLVNEIDAPISIVQGLGSASSLGLDELRQIGVRRISTGGSLARACYGAVQRAAIEMFNQGTFSYTAAAISDPGISDIMST